jgi:hypothetical protein
MSFAVKKRWNGVLSVFWFSPSGLFDPVWCRNSKLINTIPAITNIIKKIFLYLFFNPSGLFDPLWCRNTIPAITNIIKNIFLYFF